MASISLSLTSSILPSRNRLLWLKTQDSKWITLQWMRVALSRWDALAKPYPSRYNLVSILAVEHEIGSIQLHPRNRGSFCEDRPTISFHRCGLSLGKGSNRSLSTRCGLCDPSLVTNSMAFCGVGFAPSAKRSPLS